MRLVLFLHILHSIYIFQAMDREMGGIQYCIGVWTCVPSCLIFILYMVFLFWLSSFPSLQHPSSGAEEWARQRGETNRGGVSAEGNLLVNGTGLVKVIWEIRFIL